MEKHLFIVPLHDNFMPIFIGNAVDGKVFTNSEICVYYFDARGLAPDRAIEEFEKKKHGYDSRIEVVLINNKNDHDFSVFRTINLLSLNLFNSNIACSLVLCGHVDKNKINIILTDDEVDRWSNLKKLEGKLVPSKKHHVDEKLVYSLEHINNFIQLRAPWGDLLEDVLDRKVNFVHSLLFFSILQYRDQDNLFEIAGEDIVNLRKDKNSISILLFTKPKGDKYNQTVLFQILKKIIFSSSCSNHEVELSIWADRISKNPINFIICYAIKIFSKIRKRKFNFIFIQKMPPPIYFLSLMKYDFLVAQPRGGGGTIREFYKYSGQVVFYESSLNASVYKKNYCSDVFEFQDIGVALDYMISNKQESFDESRKVADAIVNLELESMRTLENFYADF